MIPAQYASHVFSITRVVFGFLYLVHGLQKLFGMFGGEVAQLNTLRGAAGIIETVGGVLVVLGLFTRPVAFITSGEMAAAYFLNHQPRATWPVNNGGELAALFCFFFLYLSARGPGPWSLDALLRRRS